MFKVKTACGAKVVNLELNSSMKQSKNGMQIDLLKRSWVVDERTLFQLFDAHIYVELQDLLSMLILPCLSLKHELK